MSNTAVVYVQYAAGKKVYALEFSDSFESEYQAVPFDNWVVLADKKEEVAAWPEEVFRGIYYYDKKADYFEDEDAEEVTEAPEPGFRFTFDDFPTITSGGDVRPFDSGVTLWNSATPLLDDTDIPDDIMEWVDKFNKAVDTYNETGELDEVAVTALIEEFFGPIEETLL